MLLKLDCNRYQKLSHGTVKEKILNYMHYNDKSN